MDYESEINIYTILFYNVVLLHCDCYKEIENNL